MPQNRGNAIIFGKITLSSEVESMDSLVSHLGKILSEHGYPAEGGPIKESTKQDIAEAQEKLAEMMADGPADN